jgi:hypothetical protein
MVLAVAAELGALKARLVSAHNWSVASDPTSSFQVRSKGKTIKGLMGDDVPYFGDHVELSDNHDDFASTLGVEGVVGIVRITSSTRWTKRVRNRPRSGHAYIRRVFETSFAGSNSATDLLKFVAEGRRKPVNDRVTY